MLSWLRRRFHRHQYIAIGEAKCVGVTLGWDGRPTRYWERDGACECGDIQPDRFIFFRHYRDEPLDAQGWPLDERGERLPIAEEC